MLIATVAKQLASTVTQVEEDNLAEGRKHGGYGFTCIAAQTAATSAFGDLWAGVHVQPAALAG